MISLMINISLNSQTPCSTLTNPSLRNLDVMVITTNIIYFLNLYIYISVVGLEYYTI